MKCSKFHTLPLVTVVVVASAFFSRLPAAQSSDLYQGSVTSDNSEAADRVIDRQVLERGQVLLIQTESEGVELLREARAVTITQGFTVTVEDDNGEVIRVFQGLGRGADLVAIATMSEAEALQVLAADSGIVEPLEP